MLYKKATLKTFENSQENICAEFLFQQNCCTASCLKRDSCFCESCEQALQKFTQAFKVERILFHRNRHLLVQNQQ